MQFILLTIIHDSNIAGKWSHIQIKGFKIRGVITILGLPGNTITKLESVLSFGMLEFYFLFVSLPWYHVYNRNSTRIVLFAVLSKITDDCQKNA